MQFFKFVILSITRILDELSFVLVDVILGYRHQVMHRSHELALDDHLGHPEEIGIGLPVVIHAFGADVEILVALFPTAHIPEAVPLQIKFDSPLLTCHADHFVASKRQPRLFESLVYRVPALPQVQNRRKILVSGDIRADFKRAEIFKDGQLLKLTPLEAQLLEIFLRNPEIIIKRGQFLEKLWDGHGNFVEDNTLTVSVSRLKNKLGVYTKGKQQYIETIRGYGYRWNLRCVISEEESSRESGR